MDIFSQSHLESIQKQVNASLTAKDFSLFNKIQFKDGLKKACKLSSRQFDKLWNKKKYDEALLYLILSLSFKELSIESLYQERFFRPSSSDFCTHTSRINALDSVTVLDFGNQVNVYIRSLLALNNFQNFISKDYVQIRKFIEDRGLPFLKTIVAFTDFLFLTEGHIAYDHFFISREAISEAVSFLAAEYFDIFGNQKNVGQVNIDESHQDAYKEILRKACGIKQFFYAELAIGKLPYKATIDNNNLVISPLDDNYEKCRILGYKVHGAKSIEKLDFECSLPSFRDILKKNCPDIEKFINLKTETVRRYTLEIPGTQEAIFAFKKIFNYPGYFEDELHMLLYTCMEFHVNFESLENYKLTKNLTIKDVVNIRRFFNFQRIIFGDFLKKKLSADPINESGIVFRSILPVSSHTSISNVLEVFFGKQKSSDFLSIFSGSPLTSSIFDLQYTPILKIGDGYFVALNILIMSDFIRNTLVAQERRFCEGNEEPLVDRIYECLIERIPNTKSNVELLEYEIDCASVSDNYVFLFEVKNSFLPCNKAEERTSYDYIIKGYNQLKNIEHLLKNKVSAMTIFQNKFGVDISKKKILSCIITGNRVFTGYRIGATSVRYVKELENFLKTGMGISEGEEYPLWNSDIFSEEDLASFILSGGTNNNFVDKCTEINHTFKISGGNLTVCSFELKPEEFYTPEFLNALKEFSDRITANNL